MRTGMPPSDMEAVESRCDRVFNKILIKAICDSREKERREGRRGDKRERKRRSRGRERRRERGSEHHQTGKSVYILRTN